MRALKRNAVPSFAALATVLVTVMLLGVFIPVVQATTGAANDVRGRVIADVFMTRDASEADIARVKNLIENDTPHVKTVEYVSKDQAYESEKKKHPEAYGALGKANPLMAMFRVTPDTPDNISKA